MEACCSAQAAEPEPLAPAEQHAEDQRLSAMTLHAVKHADMAAATQRARARAWAQGRCIRYPELAA